MRAYQPYTQFQPNLKSLLLLVWAVVGGLLFGLLLAFIDMFLYLPIIFPIVFGGLAGYSLVYFIRKWGLPNPAFATLCALLMGITIYSTMQYFEYDAFKSELRGALEERFGEIDNAQFEMFVDDFFIEETGSAGYWGYLKLHAREGIAVGKLMGSEATTFSGPGFWLYFIVDVGLLLLVMVGAVRMQTDYPFCATCNRWYIKEYLGNVPGPQVASFLALLQQGNYQKAGELIMMGNTPRPYVRLEMSHCQCERGTSILKVNEVTDAGGNDFTKEVAKGLLTANEENDLLDATTEWEEE